jgi:hypothetical protein
MLNATKFAMPAGLETWFGNRFGNLRYPGYFHTPIALTQLHRSGMIGRDKPDDEIGVGMEM